MYLYRKKYSEISNLQYIKTELSYDADFLHVASVETAN